MSDTAVLRRACDVFGSGQGETRLRLDVFLEGSGGETESIKKRFYANIYPHAEQQRCGPTCEQK